jgi:hypothetical protein
VLETNVSNEVPRGRRSCSGATKNQQMTLHKYDMRHNSFGEFREDSLVGELARLCRAGWADEVGAPILLSTLTERLSRAAGDRNR